MNPETVTAESSIALDAMRAVAVHIANPRNVERDPFTPTLPSDYIHFIATRMRPVFDAENITHPGRRFEFCSAIYDEAVAMADEMRNLPF